MVTQNVDKSNAKPGGNPQAAKQSGAVTGSSNPPVSLPSDRIELKQRIEKIDSELAKKDRDPYAILGAPPKADMKSTLDSMETSAGFVRVAGGVKSGAREQLLTGAFVIVLKEMLKDGRFEEFLKSAKGRAGLKTLERLKEKVEEIGGVAKREENKRLLEEVNKRISEEIRKLAETSAAPATVSSRAAEPSTSAGGVETGAAWQNIRTALRNTAAMIGKTACAVTVGLGCGVGVNWFVGTALSSFAALSGVGPVAGAVVGLTAAGMVASRFFNVNFSGSTDDFKVKFGRLYRSFIGSFGTWGAGGLCGAAAYVAVGKIGIPAAFAALGASGTIVAPLAMGGGLCAGVLFGAFIFKKVLGHYRVVLDNAIEAPLKMGVTNEDQPQALIDRMIKVAKETGHIAGRSDFVNKIVEIQAPSQNLMKGHGEWLEIKLKVKTEKESPGGLTEETREKFMKALVVNERDDGLLEKAGKHLFVLQNRALEMGRIEKIGKEEKHENLLSWIKSGEVDKFLKEANDPKSAPTDGISLDHEAIANTFYERITQQEKWIDGSIKKLRESGKSQAEIDAGVAELEGKCVKKIIEAWKRSVERQPGGAAAVKEFDRVWAALFHKKPDRDGNLTKPSLVEDIASAQAGSGKATEEIRKLIKEAREKKLGSPVYEGPYIPGSRFIPGLKAVSYMSGLVKTVYLTVMDYPWFKQDSATHTLGLRAKAEFDILDRICGQWTAILQAQEFAGMYGQENTMSKASVVGRIETLMGQMRARPDPIQYGDKKIEIPSLQELLYRKTRPLTRAAECAMDVSVHSDKRWARMASTWGLAFAPPVAFLGALSAGGMAFYGAATFGISAALHRLTDEKIKG